MQSMVPIFSFKKNIIKITTISGRMEDQNGGRFFSPVSSARSVPDTT